MDSTKSQISSNVQDKLDLFGSNLDLTKGPPIHQKRTVVFVNQFLITMVDFLNKFSNSCEQRLFMFDQKLRRLEDELYLLEAKINSIPGLKETSIKESKPEASEIKSSEPPTAIENEPKTKEIDNPENETIDESPPPDDNTPDKQPDEDPRYAKFRKLLHVGAPLEAVKLKMQIEGLDPSLL